MIVDEPSTAFAPPSGRRSPAKAGGNAIQAAFWPGRGKHVRLGVGMLASAVLHWLLVSLYEDRSPNRLPAAGPDGYSSFTLTLVPAAPGQFRQPSQGTRAPAAQPRPAPALPVVERPASRLADADAGATPPETSVAVDAGGELSSAAPGNAAPGLAQLLLAAKQEAALVARELNHDGGGKGQLPFEGPGRSRPSLPGRTRCRPGLAEGGADQRAHTDVRRRDAHLPHRHALGGLLHDVPRRQRRAHLRQLPALSGDR